MCCFRILPILDAMPINARHSAQFYLLAALKTFQGGMIELERFCKTRAAKDPDIPNLALAAMRSYVSQNFISLPFGCSCFACLEAAPTRKYPRYVLFCVTALPQSEYESRDGKATTFIENLSNDGGLGQRLRLFGLPDLYIKCSYRGRKRGASSRTPAVTARYYAVTAPH